MARTPSTMLPLGTELKSFSLRDAVTGETRDSAQLLAGKKGLLVMFICNHCPFVVHVVPELGRLDQDYAEEIGMVAINANNESTHPQDGPDKMKELAEAEGWSFPYLYDESQEVAAAYRAACTPDFFLFDAEGALRYRGQLDASRPGNGVPCDGTDLRAAIDALLAGELPSAEQKPSIGCNIKWLPGNEPDYFG